MVAVDGAAGMPAQSRAGVGSGPSVMGSGEPLDVGYAIDVLHPLAR